MKGYYMVDKRHLETLRYIENCVEKNGFTQTVRKLAKSLGVRSTSTVQLYLNELEEEEYIERRATMPRAIKY